MPGHPRHVSTYLTEAVRHLAPLFAFEALP